MAPLQTLVAFVAVTDLDAAAQFYGDTLGLSLRDERPFALVARAGSSSLRITKVEERSPAPYTVLGWEVEDIEAEVDGLAGRGVRFTRYDGLTQDERGIWTTPGGDRVAWFADPDGNTLSLTQTAAGPADSTAS